MDSVIAFGMHLMQQLHFVELIVAIAIGDSVDPRIHFLFVIIHADIERATRPNHPVDTANGCGHWYHIRRLHRLPCLRWCDSIESPELVANEKPSSIVGA